MAITRTPMVDDDGTGTTGTVINNAWKQQFYDQIDAYVSPVAAGPVWVDLPFNATDFTANPPMTWTVAVGNVTAFAYAITGKVVVLTLNLTSTTLGGTASTLLFVALPPAIRPGPLGATNVARVFSGGFKPAFFDLQSTRLVITLLDNTNFTVGSTHVQGEIIYRLP